MKKFFSLILVSFVLWGFSAKAQDVVKNRLQNLWKPDQYINIEKALASSKIEKGWVSAQWDFIPVEGEKDMYIIQSVWKPELRLNIENGTLAASDVGEGYHSTQWKFIHLSDKDGKWVGRFQNRWKPELFLNIEKGKLEATAVPPAFVSSHWVLEQVEE